jgi:hypothetical protein
MPKNGGGGGEEEEEEEEEEGENAVLEAVPLSPLEETEMRFGHI